MFVMDEREAFDAMCLFVRQFYDSAGDDLLTLIGDTEIQPDGQPLDPAAWEDWLRCVQAVKKVEG